jgi:hypothetical protein
MLFCFINTCAEILLHTLCAVAFGPSTIVWCNFTKHYCHKNICAKAALFGAENVGEIDPRWKSLSRAGVQNQSFAVKKVFSLNWFALK